MLSSCIMIPDNDFEWILPEIKGVVLDSLHHYPIENAKIVALSFRDTVYSDDKGEFAGTKINHLCFKDGIYFLMKIKEILK